MTLPHLTPRHHHPPTHHRAQNAPEGFRARTVYVPCLFPQEHVTSAVAEQLSAGEDKKRGLDEVAPAENDAKKQKPA